MKNLKIYRKFEMTPPNELLGLQNAIDSFSRSLGAKLTQNLRIRISVKRTGESVMRWDGLMGVFSEEGKYGLFTDLVEKAYQIPLTLAYSNPLINWLVDRSLGGVKGEDTGARRLTGIDLKILAGFSNAVLECFQNSWSSELKFNFGLKSSFDDCRLVKPIEGERNLIIEEFEVEFEGASRSFVFVIPYTLLFTSV